jgi:ribosome maturation factor RimP
MEIERLKALAEPIVKEFDCDLVLLTFQREKSDWVLRLMIEKCGSDPMVDSGVDVKLCTAVSRKFDELLEAGNLIDKNYTLEVSSPGIERPLTCKKDYERFLGRKVKIRTREVINGKKRITGTIEEVDDLAVKVKSDSGKDVMIIQFDTISKANLLYDPKRL